MGEEVDELAAGTYGMGVGSTCIWSSGPDTDGLTANFRLEVGLRNVLTIHNDNPESTYRK